VQLQITSQRSTAFYVWLVAISGVGVLLSTASAKAFPQTLNAWESRYGAMSNSGSNAGCQLCDVESNDGILWNGYGWDLCFR